VGKLFQSLVKSSRDLIIRLCWNFAAKGKDLLMGEFDRQREEIGVL
jgi:hypothetical protein